MDQHVSYTGLEFSEIQSRLVSTVTTYSQYATGTHGSVMYRVQHPNWYNVANLSVEVWPERREADCTCSRQRHLCPHIALVLSGEWQHLFPAVVPTASQLNPIDAVEVAFRHKPEVLDNLKRLAQRYDDPSFRKHWLS